MSETISKSLLDFMSDIYADRLEEIGEVHLSEVSWSPSWTIMRSTSVYDLFQPLTDGDGLSTNTSDILEDLEDINFNLTEAWNQANGWDKVGEGTNFSTWFLNWIYDAGYDLSDIA